MVKRVPTSTNDRIMVPRAKLINGQILLMWAMEVQVSNKWIF